MDTLGVTLAFTNWVIWLEVAVAGVAQFAFEVSTQVTTSPLDNDDELNDALLVPALLPFTFH